MTHPTSLNKNVIHKFSDSGVSFRLSFYVPSFNLWMLNGFQLKNYCKASCNHILILNAVVRCLSSQGVVNGDVFGG